MTADQWEQALFKFLCEFMNKGAYKRFDLVDYDQRMVLAEYIAKKEEKDEAQAVKRLDDNRAVST